MKIIDCTSFYNEHMMYDLRLNILNEKVDKFIVTESTYSHSGNEKKLNFRKLVTVFCPEFSVLNFQMLLNNFSILLILPNFR